MENEETETQDQTETETTQDTEGKDNAEPTVTLSRFTEVTRQKRELKEALEAEKAAREAAETAAEAAKQSAGEIEKLREQLGFARAGIVDEEKQVIARALYEASKDENKPSLSDWVASKPESLMRYLQPPTSDGSSGSSSPTGEAKDVGGSSRTQARAAGAPPSGQNTPFDSLKAARAAFEAAQRRGRPEEIQSARDQLNEQFRSLGIDGR